MDLHFIPRAKLVDHLSSGWRLVPGHEYSAGEYAILMFKPEVPAEMSIDDIRRVTYQFEPTVSRWVSNKSRGASTRHDRGIRDLVKS